jgi:hypothetical protein
VRCASSSSGAANLVRAETLPTVTDEYDPLANGTVPYGCTRVRSMAPAASAPNVGVTKSWASSQCSLTRLATNRDPLAGGA